MATPILKTPDEIDAMRLSGERVAEVLRLMEEMIAPGVTTIELDRAAEAVLRRDGGIPAFKGYPSPNPGVEAFPASICASINEEVVHGIPDDRPLRGGDIVSIDVGVELNGWFGDAARTFAVGTLSRKMRKLVSVTRECLEKARKRMRPGVRLRDVSGAVQETAEKNGFSVVRQFVGHGIGRRMHEPPQVPNYVSRMFGGGSLRLDPGIVLAVEPMVNVGTDDVRVLKNGWTVVTKDRSPSAHFEDSLALTEEGVVVLTKT